MSRVEAGKGSDCSRSPQQWGKCFLSTMAFLSPIIYHKKKLLMSRSRSNRKPIEHPNEHRNSVCDNFKNFDIQTDPFFVIQKNIETENFSHFSPLLMSRFDFSYSLITLQMGSDRDFLLSRAWQALRIIHQRKINNFRIYKIEAFSSWIFIFFHCLFALFSHGMLKEELKKRTYVISPSRLCAVVELPTPLGTQKDEENFRWKEDLFLEKSLV